MPPQQGNKPQFQDITLYDKDTGDPFIFTAKEQEFFWRQGFTHVPQHSPERRRELREKRYAGKELFNVQCASCGRVGKILQKPPYPKQVLCENCFNRQWEEYLEKNPEVRAIHEAAELPAN
jgi:CxxC-x17-CxxC domain-containing protein